MLYDKVLRQDRTAGDSRSATGHDIYVHAKIMLGRKAPGDLVPITGARQPPTVALLSPATGGFQPNSGSWSRNAGLGRISVRLLRAGSGRL
jgi:hypothetical protein